ncbi:FAST kinase domain-containing protein 1, mitochondrial [Neosynchiropus ocellatus]
MFRLRVRLSSTYLRRLLHQSTVTCDPVLDQINLCSVEDTLFDVVGKNKAKLTVDHVGSAVKMLWKFQLERHELLRTQDLLKDHPQFLTLQVLAENKISLMDDTTLVDTLYIFLRLNVEPHDSLIQQLVSEAWRRLDGLPMSALSKFSNCLLHQNLHLSPLMGQIADIVDQRLSSIDDARILTTLSISICSLMSPRLRDALIDRTDLLLDTMNPNNNNSARRIVQFLRNIKCHHRPLLEKCNRVLLSNIDKLDAENLGIFLSLYQALQFNNYDLTLAAKRRLMELMDSSTDPISFTWLFGALAPMASAETREQLENTAILLTDDFNSQKALIILEILEEIKSRNLSLIHRIVSVIRRNLDVYTSVEVARVAQTLIYMQYQNPDLLRELRTISLNYLQRSVYPSEVTMLTRIISMLPSARLEEVVTLRVDAVVAQCNLRELSVLSLAVAKCVRNESSYYHGNHSKYVRMMQTLNSCGHERLQAADNLDLLLEELRFVSGEWFEEMMLEETIDTLQRMKDQINWRNLGNLGYFISKMKQLCPPLMDHMASVAVKDIEKIDPGSIYIILLPFAFMNYFPAGAEELYDVCIQRFTPYISFFAPHLLVYLGYSLAVVDIFPEELIKEIFSIDFLRKLDVQIETLSNSLKFRTRMRLMDLNRAVCLVCPEYQVPWFHEEYCQNLQRNVNVSISSVQQQIHKMLAEVLGHISCVQVATVTPYFYSVDFECILDKNLQPLPYKKHSPLHISEGGKIQWGSSSPESATLELPPGAQRVAIDFLDSRSFCKNSHHMKGDALMRRRHLEILGYRVVEIPHFEWNSMELSTKEAWENYLKKKIFLRTR